MAIWRKSFSLHDLNRINQNTAVSQLGIEFTAQGDNWLEASLTVDQRHCQPMGLLHGGISAVLAETVGSLAGFCTCDEDNCECNDYVCFRYDWLNINVDSIVAYSILNDEIV